MAHTNQSIIVTNMKFIIGSDHAAFEAKMQLKDWLISLGHEIEDLGTHSDMSCHYPLYAIDVAKKVSSSNGAGILLCGSGIGVSIVANKFKGIRAALCRTEEDAELSRMHNNSNILCLGARVNSLQEMKQIIFTWMNTEFDGGRHLERIELFKNLGESVL